MPQYFQDMSGISAFHHPSHDHQDHCTVCHCWGYIDNPDPTEGGTFPLVVCPEPSCTHRSYRE